MLQATKILSKFHNREKQFFYSAASSIVTKFVNILVSVISLPLIYNCIGKERYGMMLTITSISAIITFADMGLGFGLQNKIPVLSRKSDDSLHKVISSAFFFLILTSLTILLIFFLISLNIEWSTTLRLKSLIAMNEANISVWIFAFCLTTVIPFSIVQKLQIGLQEGYLVNFWATGGNIFGLILLYVAYIEKASTPVVIMAIYGSNALFIVLNFLYHFIISKPLLIPKFKLVEIKLIKGIISESFLFFLVQMLSLVLFSANNSLLIHYHGPDQVTDFNIAYKLALLFLLPLEATAPYITPAINEAIVSKDYLWLKKATKNAILLSIFLAITTSLVTYFFGNFIISIWLGGNVTITSNVIFAVAAFMLLYANLGCVLSYIMLSSTFIRKKAIVYTLAVIVSISLKVYFIKVYAVEGAFWSTTIPMFILYVIPCLYILKTKKVA
ncbi:lipopolysaccharide biosynthesis protein [Spirosoma linguale]|uniref:Polysaccharide biosynthesis protein n=1 Tax=Spirosoma linguale (strain ATCC 33905 / DSM 74 / LMG 10896 / Claus 1) TaxID=504472 RepID=D2QRK8_SPILD|nr:polysaccharide biosynthesis protein [Spirosoma linguale DSM 74]